MLMNAFNFLLTVACYTLSALVVVAAAATATVLLVVKELRERHDTE